MLSDIVKRLFPQQKVEKRVLIVGLDAAGKTTFLYRLHLGEIVTTIPTIGFNVESVKAPTSGRRGPLALTCWDVGGCDKIRPLMRHYAAGTDALIWILDSNDRDRMSEAMEELIRMLRIVEEYNDTGGVPMPCLILANKQDLPGAMRLDEVRMKMAPIISARPSCAVFAMSLIANDCFATLTPAMDWLYDILSGVEPQQSTSDLTAQAPADALAEKLTSWVNRASKDVSPGDFLKGFEAISLPSWDHYTHIRIAYTILKIYGRQKGKTMIFDGLEKYIKTSSQTTGRTFHVTMTYFWIQIVHFGMQSMPQQAVEDDEENKEFSRFLLLNPYVVDGNLWADYYTKGVIMSPDAKEHMVLPDKKPLPNLIARDSVRK